MNEITGLNFIGNERSGEGSNQFNPINPSNGEKMLPGFYEATDQEINMAIKKAADAFQEYRLTDGLRRADFLDNIADEIERTGDILVQR